MNHSLTSGFVLAAFGLVVLSAPPTQAVPIQYVFTLPVTGSLNGQSFTNALVTITATGDTTALSGAGMGVPINSVGSPTFTLTGFGSGTLTQTYNVFDDQNFTLAGLMRVTGGAADIFSEKAPAFATYGLDTSLGPVVASQTGSISSFTLASSQGDLTLDGYGPGATFTATTKQSSVPEPSSMVLFAVAGIGLAGLMIRARKRQAMTHD